MTNILFSFFAFIITILFLVFIHEYGHFWVARRFGVRIEKFSIGFGKPIFKWHGKRDNTEYSLSWIPLGGYVKMYGETASAQEGETSVTETAVDLSQDNVDNETGQPNASNSHLYAMGSFSALPPFKRMLIAFAGPAVNLLFAFFALWILYIIGVPAWKPTLGSVMPNTELAKAHVTEGDTILSVNGSSVASLTDATIALIDALGKNDVSMITVDNTGEKRTAKLDLSNYKPGDEMAVDKLVGFHWALNELGNREPATIQSISPNSPAAKANLKTGDMVVAINEKPVNNWKDFVTVVHENPEKMLNLRVLRNGQEQALTLVAGLHPKNPKIGFAGVSHTVDSKLYDAIRTTKRYGVLEALPQSISANYMQATLMLKTLGRLIGGKVSVENLGGPISIADYSGRSLSAGYVTYFNYLAIISLILAVMNLLPIPVLDGGHIILCFVEIVRGKPLSNKALDMLMRLGGSVLLTFMLFVISVDVWRYLFK